MNINDLLDTKSRIDKRKVERKIVDQIQAGLLPLNDHPYFTFEGKELVSVRLSTYSRLEIPVHLIEEVTNVMRKFYLNYKDVPVAFQVGLDFLKDNNWYRNLPSHLQGQLNLKSFTEYIQLDYWFTDKKCKS